MPTSSLLSVTFCIGLAIILIQSAPIPDGTIHRPIEEANPGGNGLTQQQIETMNLIHARLSSRRSTGRKKRNVQQADDAEAEQVNNYITQLNALLRGRHLSRQTFVSGQQTTPKPIDFENATRDEKDEYDVKFSLAQIIDLYAAAANNGRKRRKRKVTHYSFRKWPLPINYKFHSTKMWSSRRTEVRNGIAEWESKTCLKFTEIGDFDDPGTNHVLFTDEGGCWSYIGKTYYEQKVSLGGGCYSRGTIAHEIGHMLGMFHEHNRPDRYKWIQVHWNRIQSGLEYAFSQATLLSPTYVPYDFNSVMHYSPFAFSTGGVTTEPFNSYFGNVAGQRSHVAFSDAKAMNLHYCSDTCSGQSLAGTCKNGGYQDPKDCSKCRCDKGFEGTLCDQRFKGSPNNCGSEIFANGGQTGIIGDYPELTQYGQRCVWAIYAPDHYLVKLEMIKYGGYNCGYAYRCNQWLEVKFSEDWEQTGALVCSCSGRMQSVITSQTNKMLIVQWQDIGQRILDVKAKWTIVENPEDPPPGGATTTTSTSAPTTTTTQAPSTTTASSSSASSSSSTTTTTGFERTTTQSASATTTVSTTQGSSTTTDASATPSPICCTSGGNEYCQSFASRGCTEYTQNGIQMQCAYPTIFDPAVCGCNWSWYYLCPVPEE